MHLFTDKSTLLSLMIFKSTLLLRILKGTLLSLMNMLHSTAGVFQVKVLL